MVSRATSQTGLTSSSAKGERNESEDRTSEADLESPGMERSDGRSTREQTKSRLDLLDEITVSEWLMFAAISTPRTRKVIQRIIQGKRLGRPEADDRPFLQKMAIIRRSDPTASELSAAMKVVEDLPVIGTAASGSPQVKAGERVVSKEHFRKHLADKYKIHEPELMRALDNHEHGYSVGDAALHFLKNGDFAAAGASACQHVRNRPTSRKETGHIITPEAVDGVLEALGWRSRDFFRQFDFPSEGLVPRQWQPKPVSNQTAAQVLKRLMARKSRLASGGVLCIQPLPAPARVISPDDFAG